MTCWVALGIGCESNPQPPRQPTPPAVVGPVTIEVATAKGTQVIEIQEVRAGTTVEGLMGSIKDVEIVITGSGSTAFLNKIGDLETAGSEGWTYKVDGEHVHEGIGTLQITPPTTITWTYGDYQTVPLD